jgi:RNA polymerase sigma factor (sigma-70 family)
MLPEGMPDVFEAQRPRLLRLAYRMLGSMADAEDVVQEAWLRWQRADRSDVSDIKAYLSRIVTRLCLDMMKSARARHEVYVGPWLPEPIIDTEGEEARADELTLTLMLALERLSPLERAAFLLHDVFAVPLDEVATTLDRDAAAVRQLAVRARKHVRDARPRYQVGREEGDRIAKAFFEASSQGDPSALRSMLAENAVVKSDGGGKVVSFINPIVGIDRVVRMFAGIARKFAEYPPEMIKPIWIDGLPGYASYQGKHVLQTTAFAIEDGLITGIYITRNPDKLARVAEALNLPR